eukprot:Gb_10820 [translate_table: standard]
MALIAQLQFPTKFMQFSSQSQSPSPPQSLTKPSFIITCPNLLSKSRVLLATRVQANGSSIAKFITSNVKTLFLDKYFSIFQKLFSCPENKERPWSFWVWCATLAIVLNVATVNIDDANAYVVTPSRKLQSDELTTVKLFKDNTPSVVYITNLAVRQDAFTLDVLEVPQGSGSGFIWDQKGHIVTNYHVIRGASDLR